MGKKDVIAILSGIKDANIKSDAIRNTLIHFGFNDE